MKYMQSNTKLDWKPGSTSACLEAQNGTLLSMARVTLDEQGKPITCSEPTLFVADIEPITAHRLTLKHLWDAGYDTRLA